MPIKMKEIDLTPEEKKWAREWREKKMETDPDNPFTKTMNEMHPEDIVVHTVGKEDPLLHLIKTVKRVHIGDTHIIALLCLSGLSSGFKDRKKLIHIMVVGGFSKGKSSVQDHVEMIFSGVETVTSSSAKSQFYKAQAGQLPDGGVIRFDESEGSQEAVVLERALTDDTLNEPTHDTVNDKKQFVQLRIEEVNAVWKNRVDTQDDDQLNSRYIIANVDETPEQDEEVYKKTLEEFSYNEIVGKEDEEFKKARLLTDKIKSEPIKILIPFGLLIENKQKENRRSTKKFLRILCVIVYCYRFQRSKFDDYYIATKKDFQIAQLIWNLINEFEATQLNEKHLKLLKLLPSSEDTAVDRKYLADRLNVSVDTVYNRLKKLIDLGHVDYKEERENTRKYLYWRLKDFEGLLISLDWYKFTIEALYTFLMEKTKKTREKLDEENIKQIYNSIMNTVLSGELLDLLKNEDKEPIIQNNKENKDLGVPQSPKKYLPLPVTEEEVDYFVNEEC